MSAIDRVVIEEFSTGTPIAEIARRLGVKLRHVEYRARKLGLTHRSRLMSLEERFWNYANPEPNTGCFLWSGHIGPGGYAHIGVNGSRKRASHVALELAGRSLPVGLNALHHCDNPACVNPDHLFVGTQRDNARDCIAKGRYKAPPPSKPGQGVRAFCVRGHPLSGDNLYFHGGKRWCRECRRLACAQQKAALKAARAYSRSPRQEAA